MLVLDPRMRAEHWRAYGSSNFKNYVSFGAIPADKATIMLLLDHLDLATGKFFFKDSQTGTPQAYTFDKSEAAIHILLEQDVTRYVHEEIKQKPTTVKAKVEEEVTGEKSLGKKRVQKENEAYEKLMMLNEAYEQVLVARGVDILAIKAETEKNLLRRNISGKTKER
ncbi:uncharacterized protein A4U43_C02F14650 [Asparagus officinalis]|uniref:Uncharacterized protein n=1 Tax=Asparagus officinalis TaxID=4686 RepID=A0A5P1FMC9_ASPOF|nr:uncharacterized protein A4U43_C02F14650 [Asparagus officinalis]